MGTVFMRWIWLGLVGERAIFLDLVLLEDPELGLGFRVGLFGLAMFV